MQKAILISWITLCSFFSVNAQYLDSSVLAPDKLLISMKKQSAALAEKVAGQTNLTLTSFSELENRLLEAIAHKDSITGSRLIREGKEAYEHISSRLSGVLPAPYIGRLDTLMTSLTFLHANFVNSPGKTQTLQRIEQASQQLQSIQEQFAKAHMVQDFLMERLQSLQTAVLNSGISNKLTGLRKKVFYYQSEMRECRELIQDRKKLASKSLTLITASQAFQSFMQKHGQLAILFGSPGGSVDTIPNLTGLQTRAEVSQLIQLKAGAIGSKGADQIQASIKDAQQQLRTARDQVFNFTGGGDFSQAQPGFKPNSQKVKTFWNRLELAANIQSQRRNGPIPRSSDLGISVGYRFNDEMVAGIGGAYRFSLGENFSHIHLSHLGIGLRSYADLKIKKSFWATGAYEWNHQSIFKHLDELRDINAWQQSGLVGITKVVSLKSKFLKQTKAQLLWDFLSYSQIPVTQPILFRVNYTF